MAPPRVPRPVRAARNAAYRIAATLSEVEALKAELGEVSARVADLGAEMSELGGHVERLGQETTDRSEQGRQQLLDTIERSRRESLEILQLLRDDEPETRRRLWAVRETQAYLQAYNEAEPLVTVTIPTYEATEQLLERSLPSVLAQTYERLEVLVVGDGAAPEVEHAIGRVGDSRIRYVNLTHRGPYPEDAALRWMVAGGPAANEGMRMAAGRWIAQVDDDDSCPPNRVELLLSAARAATLGVLLRAHPRTPSRRLDRAPVRVPAAPWSCLPVLLDHARGDVVHRQ